MSGAQEEKDTLETSVAQAAVDAAADDKALPSIQGPGVQARYTGRSVVGLVREHNEDNLIVSNLVSGAISARDEICVDPVSEAGLLFAVCDGMGGAAAGEVASQLAVEIIHEAMRRGGAPKNRDELARRLVSAVEEAGKRIFEGAQKERSRRGMGTTATVAVLVDKVLFLAEVGDSRAYLLRGGVLKQLTKDQSLVNQLIEAGHLTEAEAEAFEHSNIILQALGTSETVQVDLTFVELRKGDRLMMCSDGLSGLVHGDTIRDALASIEDPSECTATLIKYAEAGGGHDNITVVVVDFDGDALEEPRETDTFGYLQYPLLPADVSSEAFPDEEVTGAGLPPAAMAGASRKAQRDDYADDDAPETRSSLLWVSAGVVALLIGAWVLAVSGSGGRVTAEAEVLRAPQRASEETQAVARQPEAPAPAAVPVKVWSDVQDATLLVNGEARGRFSAGESQSLELRPGAYRFEAQSQGNIAAVEVVTVRPDVPLEVHLRLPSGAVEQAPSQANPSEEPSEEPTEEPSEEPTVAAEAPRSPAARRAPRREAAPVPAAPVLAAPDQVEPKPAAPVAPKPRSEAVAAPDPKPEATKPVKPEVTKPAATEPAIPDNPF